MTGQIPTPPPWDVGFKLWKKDEMGRLVSHARWLVKSINRLCITQRAKQHIMSAVPLRTSLANSLRYWWKMECTRREQLRIIGCRAMNLQDSYTRNKVEEVKAALEAAGIEALHFEGGKYRGELVHMSWDVHAKGIVMYAWCKHKRIAEATYYTQLLFKNKTLDLILGS